MFPLTLLLLLGLAASVGAVLVVVARAKAALTLMFGAMALGVAVLSLVTGFLGQQYGLHQTEKAIAMVNPDDQALIRAG